MNSIKNYGLSNYQSSCNSRPNFKAGLSDKFSQKVLKEMGYKNFAKLVMDLNNHSDKVIIKDIKELPNYQGLSIIELACEGKNIASYHFKSGKKSVSDIMQEFVTKDSSGKSKLDNIIFGLFGIRY